MANEAVNSWIRQASGKTPAPVATEQPQTPKIPPGNAGSGAAQTGPFRPKVNMNEFMRAYAGRGRKY